jgi:FkbM family methyltransferase
MIKDTAYRTISDLGHAFTPEAYSKGLEMAGHLRKLFSLLNISCVIDVGANEGQFRNYLRRRCGYKGLIISFEPVRSVFNIIEKRAKHDAKWLVNNYALGAQRGSLQINVMQDSHFSSFLTPATPEIDHPDIRVMNVIKYQEEVEVRTLEGVIEELRSKFALGNIYLKMDTQGYDFEVLRGAGKSLQTISALQTEVPVKPLYEGMTTFQAAISDLAKYGFEVTGLFSVERDRLLRVVEFDCVAIRVSGEKNLVSNIT